MKTVHPYLNFAGNTEEAFEFYRSVFGGEFTGITRFRDFGENGMGVPAEELDLIANIGLPLTKDITLMGTDLASTMGRLSVGNNNYILLETESVDEARRLFDGLSEGGTVQMPLQKTEWAETYGSFIDRYGVPWMVMKE